jgi:hypothetical protein
MKRGAILTSLVSACMMASAITVLASEGRPTGGEEEQMQKKDECLLVAINCGSDYDTLEQRIDRLQKEISKGSSVYTPVELRLLKEKLDNARKTLEFFRYEGASLSDIYRFPGE